jgi:hypothetical protein
MTELIVVEKIAEWQRLKALVLESVSSPITRRVYNMALDEFIAWVPTGAASRVHQGDRERLASITGSPRTRVVVHHHSNARCAQTGCRGSRQRAAGA